ncbi:MAG: hypothetical protein Q9162_002179 [Coniocarpon cinnabarinum]
MSPHLLTLPIEIRTQIWHLALGDPFYDPSSSINAPVNADHNIGFDDVIVQPPRPECCDVIEPYWGLEPMTRLLRVNRQIHDEATRVLYGHFMFHFVTELDEWLLDDFLGILSGRAKSLIRAVGLRLHVGPQNSRLTHGFKPVRYHAQLRRLRNALPNLNLVRCGVVLHCDRLPWASMNAGGRTFEDTMEDVWGQDVWKFTQVLSGIPRMEAFVMPDVRIQDGELRRVEAWLERIMRAENGAWAREQG